MNSSTRSAIIGGCQNTIGTASCNSVILGGSNLSLINQSDTVLVPTLLVSGSFSTDSGSNFGIDGTFSTGINTITVCNGIIISII